MLHLLPGRPHCEEEEEKDKKAADGDKPQGGGDQGEGGVSGDGGSPSPPPLLLPHFHHHFLLCRQSQGLCAQTQTLLEVKVCLGQLCFISLKVGFVGVLCVIF